MRWTPQPRLHVLMVVLSCLLAGADGGCVAPGDQVSWPRSQVHEVTGDRVGCPSEVTACRTHIAAAHHWFSLSAPWRRCSPCPVRGSFAPPRRQRAAAPGSCRGLTSPPIRPRRGIRRSPISTSRMSAGLQVAWEWEPKERPQETGAVPNNFSGTPIMIDNVVYISTMYTRVVALDAETGDAALGVRPRSLQVGPERAGDRLHASWPHALVGWRQAVPVPGEPPPPDQARRHDRQAGGDLREGWRGRRERRGAMGRPGSTSCI